MSTTATLAAASLLDTLLANPRYLVGTALAAAGVGACVHQQVMNLRVARSRHWPSVSGRVVAAGRTIQRLAGEVTGGVRASEIVYTYRVGDRSFESDVVCLGGQLDTSTGGPADERLARYGVGDTVDVYYNPANPQQACLERVAEAPWLTYLVGFAFITIGTLLATGVIRASE